MVLALAALGLLLARRTDAERAPGAAGRRSGAGRFRPQPAFVAVGSDSLITRNIIALWLPAAMLVGAGLASARPRRIGVDPHRRPVRDRRDAATGGRGQTTTCSGPTGGRSPRPRRRAAPAIGTSSGRRRIDGRVILIQHYRTLLPLSLYMPGLHFCAPSSRSACDEIDVISMSSPQQPLCWWGAACNLIPSQMQTQLPDPGFPDLWVRHVHRFTIMRLVAAHPVILTRRTVASGAARRRRSGTTSS